MIKRPDFAEELRAEARRAIVVAHQYRLDYAGSGLDAIFLFFEGLDDKKYYLPFVQRFRRVEVIHSYTCDGKGEVVEAWRILDRWGLMDLDRALFFLDRDHDRYLKIEEIERTNIFVTSGYSIENYLVSAEAVSVVLSQYTPFSGMEGGSYKILAEFRSGYEDFVGCMRPMMAWCIRVRAQGEKPNLANVNLKTIVNVEPKGRVARMPCAFRKFRKACGTDVKLTGLEYREQIMRLRDEPVKWWLRGKYELWFPQQFLNGVFKELIGRSSKKRVSRRVRRPKALEGGDLVELLAGRVSYPGELTEFLRLHGVVREVVSPGG